MITDTPVTHLLSCAGRTALHGFLDSGTLFAFDLDGTLAPIVADPGDIVIPGKLRRQLIDLNNRAPVAVITGRSRSDALSHLGFTPRFLVGNHGAEGLPGCEESERGYVLLCRAWMQQLAKLLPDGNDSNVVIEDKGATLSLHYRNSYDQERAIKEILNAISSLRPVPKQVSGKAVVNLVPRDAPDKGKALLSVMAHLECSRAIFVGDDVTDEDVFRLGDDRIFGVRVGMSARSAARYYLLGQEEIGNLFDEIMDGYRI